MNFEDVKILSPCFLEIEIKSIHKDKIIEFYKIVPNSESDYIILKKNPTHIAMLIEDSFLTLDIYINGISEYIRIREEIASLMKAIDISTLDIFIEGGFLVEVLNSKSIDEP